MTALAFLFAVFLARPCPFYILDEVEAALDDLNLDRFLALLRRYCGARAVHRHHPPEADDGGGRLAVRRLDGPGRRLEGDLAPPGLRAADSCRDRRRSPRSPERAAAAIVAPLVPRDWSDLFITAEARRSSAGEQEEQPRRGFFRRLRESMSRTRQALGSEIQATLFATLDEHTWERLEEALIMADVGAPTTAAVVGSSSRRPSAGTRGRGGAQRAADRAAGRDRARGRTAHRPARQAHRDHGRRRQRHGQDDDDRQARLAPAQGARRERPAGRRRHLPRRRRRAARRLGRARAAARSSPARRARTPARSPSRRSRRRAAAGVDVVIVDTAGRLHTQDELMAELGEGPARDRAPARGRPARDAADDRRHDRARTGSARRACSPRPPGSAASC